jgi:hypothetical protein
MPNTNVVSPQRIIPMMETDMECGCAVRGHLDPRCRERGMCGRTAREGLKRLADALVNDTLEMSDEEILAETTPEELAEALRIRDKALAAHNLAERDQ